MKKAIPIFVVILLVALVGGLSACGQTPVEPEQEECQPTLYEPEYGMAIPEMCAP